VSKSKSQVGIPFTVIHILTSNWSAILENRSATVIGVMPPSFQFLDKNAQLWLPISADDRWATFQEIRFADAFSALARLKPGLSIEEARAEMNAVAGRLARHYSATDANLRIRVVPLFDQIAGAQLIHIKQSLRRSKCSASCTEAAEPKLALEVVFLALLRRH
jgi:hypothetical protein